MKKFLAMLFLLISYPLLAKEMNYHFILSSSVGSAQDLTIIPFLECLKEQHSTTSKEYAPGAQGKIAFDKLNLKVDDDKNINILLGNVGVLALSDFTSIDFLKNYRTVSYASRTDIGLISSINSTVGNLSDLKTIFQGKTLLVGVSAPSLEYILKILEKDLSINMEIVRYKQIGQAYSDLVQGSINFVLDTVPSALSLVKANKLKFIATNISKNDELRKSPELGKSDFINLDSKFPTLGTILVVKRSAPDKEISELVHKMNRCNNDSKVQESLIKYNTYVVNVSESKIKTDLENFIKQIK